MADLLKPGEKAPRSGQYEIVGPRGGKQQGQEIKVSRGELLPQTPKDNQRLRYVEGTRSSTGAKGSAAGGGKASSGSKSASSGKSASNSKKSPVGKSGSSGKISAGNKKSAGMKGVSSPRSAAMGAGGKKK